MGARKLVIAAVCFPERLWVDRDDAVQTRCCVRLIRDALVIGRDAGQVAFYDRAAARTALAERSLRRRYRGLRWLK